ncbi:MAG: hypothetical protein Q8P12_01675, partial [bacterium]|nr:hypothetical protein [bacterium]
TTFSDPTVLDELSSRLETVNSKLEIEADLMVSDPRGWVERLRHPGVTQLIFHVESIENQPDWKEIFLHARALGFRVGIASEPETPFLALAPLLPLVDRYQAMGGRSGFGGQEFNPAVLKTVRTVRQEFPRLPISIDIGVNSATAFEMVEAGATILCAGSAVFKSDNVGEAVLALKRAAENG